MKRNLLTAAFIFSISIAFSQNTKLNNVYLYMPVYNSSYTYTNPLEFGIVINRKNKSDKWIVGLTAYSKEHTYKGYLDTSANRYNYSNFFEYRLDKGDSIAYQFQESNNTGVGIRLGTQKDHKFLGIDVVWRNSISIIANLNNNIISNGYTHYQDSMFLQGQRVSSLSYLEIQTSNSQTNNVSIMSQFSSDLGIFFKMGEKVSLIPKINLTINVYNGTKLGGIADLYSPRIDLTLRGGFQLAYIL